MGVSMIMLGFPLLMYYMYIGAAFYDGHLPTTSQGQSFSDFAKHLIYLAYTHAFPHRKAWIMYWTFLVVEGIGYLYLPGVYGRGKCLPYLHGKQLDYYCSAIWA
jgi:delta24(24(1))-sterol reductase